MRLSLYMSIQVNVTSVLLTWLYAASPSNVKLDEALFTLRDQGKVR